MNPRTQPWPDWPIVIPSASARITALLDLARASSTRPRWAATIAAGNSSVGMTRPSCVRSSRHLMAH